MNMSDFRIIEFEPKYQKDVVDLVGNLLVFTGTISKEDLPVDDEDLVNIPETYNGLSGFWLAVVKDKLIGTVGMKDMGNGVVKLKRMFVLPENHGSGVGQVLLNYAIEQAHKKRFTKMVLNTNEHMTRAHHFYEKNGFVKTGKVGAQLHYEKDLLT